MTNYLCPDSIGGVYQIARQWAEEKLCVLVHRDEALGVFNVYDVHSADLLDSCVLGLVRQLADGKQLSMSDEIQARTVLHQGSAEAAWEILCDQQDSFGVVTYALSAPKGPPAWREPG